MLYFDDNQIEHRSAHN